MPDHDRNPSFLLHTLSQDPGDGAVRCPSCRGTGVTFQADCVFCGRQVVACTQAPSGPKAAEDITNSVKALSIKAEPDSDQRSSPHESVNFPSLVPVPAGSSNERQRRSNVPTLRSYNHSERPGVGTREGTRYGLLSQLQHHPASDCRSAVRIYQQPQYIGRSSSSTSRRSSRGAGRGSGGASAHPNFKGVRTRRGVKGFLVEIRPPKWKKTIWLGTYNTLFEAAGAYDAGVFYTKKANAKYNFPTSEGAFPPLPSHLQLDTVDSMRLDEIKVFVQNQAKEAATRVGNAMCTGLTQAPQTSHVENVIPVTATSITSALEPANSSVSCLTSSHGSVNADLQTASNASSSEVNTVGSESGFHIPMDLGLLDQGWEDIMFMYYTYLRQEGGPDQELLLPELDDDV